MSEVAGHAKVTEHVTPSLVAYSCGGNVGVPIVPAGRWRPWMDETESRWPNRCLPLLMANESGWWLLNPQAFTATWDGRQGQAGLTIDYDETLTESERMVTSHFGHGILTWGIPYLFTTDPGWDLLVRGPVNLPKDGVCALEGLVATDWSTAAFTMNWMITRARLPVRFEAGEPFCMIVPQRRYDLESIAPRVTQLEENAELSAAFQAWLRRRDELLIAKFLLQYGKVDGTDSDSWQKDYFKGRTASGEVAKDHRTKRSIRPFESSALPNAASEPPSTQPTRGD